LPRGTSGIDRATSSAISAPLTYESMACSGARHLARPTASHGRERDAHEPDENTPAIPLISKGSHAEHSRTSHVRRSVLELLTRSIAGRETTGRRRPAGDGVHARTGSDFELLRGRRRLFVSDVRVVRTAGRRAGLRHLHGRDEPVPRGLGLRGQRLEHDLRAARVRLRRRAGVHARVHRRDRLRRWTDLRSVHVALRVDRVYGQRRGRVSGRLRVQERTLLAPVVHDRHRLRRVLRRGRVLLDRRRVP
jgi:hypothetical protein